MVEDAQALGDIYLFILLLFNLLFTDFKIIKMSLLFQPIFFYLIYIVTAAYTHRPFQVLFMLPYTCIRLYAYGREHVRIRHRH